MAKRRILLWGAAVLVAAGCGLSPKASSAPGVTVETGSPATASEPSTAPTTDAPKPTATPTPTKKPTPKATPTTRKPVTPVITCSGYAGTNLSKSTVKAYLTDAALQDEYAAMDPAALPPELKGVRPVVRVPLTLLKAIAVRIAAALLQQLTVHFGIVYFHSTFDLARNAALRHVVVAAYNVGRGNVESGGKIKIGPTGTTYYKAVDEQMLPAADCQHWG